MRFTLRTALVVFLCLGLGAPLSAQDAGSKPESGGATVRPEDQASREEVLKFMEVLHMQRSMRAMIGSMKAGAKAGVFEGFRQDKHREPTAQEAKMLETVLDASMEDFPFDRIMDAMIPVYQRHLSRADMEASIAFYTSPAGQRIINEMPSIMQEAQQVGLDMLPSLMTGLKTKIEKRVAEALSKDDSAKPDNGANSDSKPKH